MATGAAPGCACIIRPMAQCSIQAAWSRVALSDSRLWRSAWMRINCVRAPRASRIMQAAWAVHLRNNIGATRQSCARRRQSMA